MEKPVSGAIERVDARKVSRTVLHEKREQAVALRQKGTPIVEIVQRTGLSRTAVRSAIRSFAAGGASALMPGTRGRKSGTGRALTEEQEAKIRLKLRRRRPWYYELRDSLWNHGNVQKLIANKCRVNLSERAVRKYLSRWGLTLGGANRQPRERCSIEVRAWLDVHYADLQQRAHTSDAEIYWLNRPVNLDSHNFVEVDQSPDQISEAGKKGTPSKIKKVSLISASTNQGQLLWAINKSPVLPSRQIQFMDALRKDTRKKVLFLIRPDLNAYRSQDVTTWLRENKLGIRMFPE